MIMEGLFSLFVRMWKVKGDFTDREVLVIDRKRKVYIIQQMGLGETRILR